MNVPAYTVSLIETGDFKLDGGAMFGVVPKLLWNRVCPADDVNRIAMTCRCLLIEGKGKKILVDTGIGDKDDDKFREMFAVDFARNTLMDSLNARGVHPDDITDVILTHLHFDHCGGSTCRQAKSIVPVFAHARHYVQKRQYEQALSRSERDRASYFPANYEPLREAGMLEFLDGDVELFPGIEILLSNGHTPGLQTIRIDTGEKRLWYPADLIPMAAHIPLPWIMGYDLFPMTTLEDKKKYLARAADEEWTVVFEHDRARSTARLKRDDRGHIAVGDGTEP